jgi:tetratricopeptide (TPR) repeat protein
MAITAGKTKEAVEAYRQSLALFQKEFDDLPSEDPQHEIVHHNMAVVHSKLGHVSRQCGDLAAAREHYQEGLRLRKALAERQLRNPELQDGRLPLHAVAESHLDVGFLILQRGDPVGARPHLEQALVLREKLLRGPADQKGLQALAQSYQSLADLNLQLNDREASRKYYTDLLKICQNLVAADPNHIDHRKDLATAYENLGDVNIFWRRRLKDALGYYENALRVRQELVRSEPNNSDLQAGAASAHYRVGTVKLLLGQKSASGEEFRRSLQLREKLAAADPTNAYRKFELMFAQARCGQHTKAAELAALVQKTGAGDPFFLYQATCGYALCIAGLREGKDKDQLTPEERAQERRYADLAVESLGRAIVNGFNNRVSLETDPELAAIQDEPRFQALRKQLENAVSSNPRARAR